MVRERARTVKSVPLMVYATIVLAPKQRLASIRKDFSTKKRVAYVAVDRAGEWAMLCQSLPLLAKWINTNLSTTDYAWDRVSVTGLYDYLDRPEDTLHGAWHKGRFRLRSVPLVDAIEVFENTRKGYQNAAIIASNPQSYSMRVSSQIAHRQPWAAMCDLR